MKRTHHHLSRVKERLGNLILAYTDKHRTFRLHQLTDAVSKHLAHKISPESPGRVLRILRQKKVLDYKVLSRKDSLYHVSKVNA